MNGADDIDFSKTDFFIVVPHASGGIVTLRKEQVLIV